VHGGSLARVITDAQRTARGLRTVDEVLELAAAGTVVLDPYSLLIGVRVQLGAGNVFYPGVVIECDDESTCVLGSENTLLPGTFITATGGASISLGDGSRIGEGSTRITADGPDAVVKVGNRTRISSNPILVGPAELGDGSQLIGQIIAQGVQLGAGADWTHPDPDARGAVLKGFGRARGLTVGAGEVINGSGDFAEAPLERQRTYHPNAPRVS
jgi:hypothetical protein